MLDSGAAAAGLLMEIPTGAVADLIGKKKTLIAAFFLQGVGNLLMAISGNIWMLAVSLWLFVCVGGAFYSGTLEALVFDSLKSVGDENTFDKKMGVVSAIKLWSIAICGLLGGLSYIIWPGLPFALSGLVCLVGMFACMWLTEPKIDTEKTSIRDFLRQNTLGLRTLFGGAYLKKLTVFLAVTGAFGAVIFELLDDLLAIEYGYTPVGVSVLFSLACLLAGFVSFYFPRLKLKVNHSTLLIVSVLVMAATLLFSPFIGVMAFGGFTLLRIIFEVLYSNSTSVIINNNIESSVRATTLSTLSLLRSVPYALGGTFIGATVLFVGGAKSFAVGFGLVLFILTLLLGRGIKKPA